MATRYQELIAIHDTIKILHDDEVFEGNQEQVADRASVRRDSREVIALASNGEKVDFSKVIERIEDMVTLLDECNGQMDQTEDPRKGLKQTIGELETVMIEANDNIAKIHDRAEETNKDRWKIYPKFYKAPPEGEERIEKALDRAKEESEYKGMLARALQPQALQGLKDRKRTNPFT